MAGESSGSASGSSPDGAAGVWTPQLSNPGHINRAIRAVQQREKNKGSISDTRALAVTSTGHSEN